MGATGEDDLAGVSVQLVRLAGDLPAGFEHLRDAATGEGHRHMARLEAEMTSGTLSFQGDGEALIAAFVEGELAGIGGVTHEPTLEAGAALRMRRLYVARAFRRRGVAAAIANALLQEALCHNIRIVVHAGNPGAERFWESQGYVPVTGQAWSYVFQLH